MKNMTVDGAALKRSLRVDALDVYKGLAILLVVIGHIALNRVSTSGTSILFNCIQMFHMPMFFVICGMVFALKPTRMSVHDFGPSVVRRGVQLLVPFIAWYLLEYALSSDRPSLEIYFTRLYKSPDYGLWFLWVLFVMSVVADALKVLSAAVRLPFFVGAVVVWALFLHASVHFHALGSGLIAIEWPFFVAGIFHKPIMAMVGKRAAVFVVAASIAYPFAVLIWDRLSPPPVGFMLQKSLSLPMSTAWYTVYIGIGSLYQAMFAVVGTIVFFGWAQAFTASGGAQRWVTTFLIYIGERTLAIYAIHLFFVKTPFIAGNAVLDGIVTLAVCLLMSVVISEYIIKPMKVTDLLLLGKVSKPSAKA
ncbi:acyltransferase family protein [Cupriavidus sp.]|uniref:acyltransferase family protein n=1 Tax=Cupriavidus sp. TaxID=1873897 RepID=UPI0028BE10A4|nr:acyltransferase family protein [Cupriavidus sp.]